MTRTEISFEVCQINTRVKNAIVAGILPVNKVMKSTSNSIGIPNLNLKSLSLQMQTLTTYHMGENQGRYITILSDKHNNLVRFSWSNTMLQHAACSILAEE